MTSSAAHTAFDAERYLAWEEQQAEKHEYVGGEVFAMVGARREHVVVAGNLFAAFKQRLRGGPCQVYISDLKLRVETADAFFYPDVMVSCDARDHAASQFIAHSILIVEVLSESTAATNSRRIAPFPRCRNTCWSTSHRAGWRPSDEHRTRNGCCMNIPPTRASAELPLSIFRFRLRRSSRMCRPRSPRPRSLSDFG